MSQTTPHHLETVRRLQQSGAPFAHIRNARPLSPLWALWCSLMGVAIAISAFACVVSLGVLS